MKPQPRPVLERLRRKLAKREEAQRRMVEEYTKIRDVITQEAKTFLDVSECRVMLDEIPSSDGSFVEFKIQVPKDVTITDEQFDGLVKLLNEKHPELRLLDCMK